jgi:hypothetical protein
MGYFVLAVNFIARGPQLLLKPPTPVRCCANVIVPVAEAGIAVFRIAFERWVQETNQRDLPELIRDSLDELKAVTAGK